MLFVVQDGLSRPRLYRPARPRFLHTRPPRSIPHNEPIALRQLQRRHPHQPPRYQSGALLLHELCRRVQPRGCITDCLTPEKIHRILISMPGRSPSERAPTYKGHAWETAIGLLFPAEIVGVVWVRGLPLQEYLASFASGPGVISLLMFLLFAAMPTLVTRGWVSFPV